MLGKDAVGKYNLTLWAVYDYGSSTGKSQWAAECAHLLRETERLKIRCGSHQYIYIWKSVVSDFATPWTIQFMEFSSPECWSGYPFPSPGDLPNPRIEPRSPTLQTNSLPAEPQVYISVSQVRRSDWDHSDSRYRMRTQEIWGISTWKRWTSQKEFMLPVILAIVSIVHLASLVIWIVLFSTWVNLRLSLRKMY